MRPYEEAKSLLFESQYTLERKVPDFISQKLGIATTRTEEYVEDFWVMNANDERVITGEVKSIVKGFKKSAIFSLYNHREARGLDESVPAMLVVNPNLQAGSWSEKDRPIDKQDYEVAAQNGILILRIEDLIRLWVAKTRGLVTTEEILILWITKKGWLRVTKELEIQEVR